jgi:hypothetical protein
LPAPIYICASFFYLIVVMCDWTILHCLKRTKQQLKFAKYHLFITVQNRRLCARLADDSPECQLLNMSKGQS